jgi:hypothetical protein
MAGKSAALGLGDRTRLTNAASFATADYENATALHAAEPAKLARTE